MTKEELIMDLKKEFEKSRVIADMYEEKNDFPSASFFQGQCSQILMDIEKIKQLKST